MESLEIKKYNNFDVSFLLGGRNVKVNATEMAKIFGKRVSDFLQNDGVKEFILEMELTLKSVNSNVVNLIENRGAKGTWMHRTLALKFASWLNVKFEVWVYMTIEKILFGNIVEEKTKKEERANRRAELMDVLIKTPEYLELMHINFEDKVSNNKIKAQFNRQLQIF